MKIKGKSMYYIISSYLDLNGVKKLMDETQRLMGNNRPSTN